MLAFPREHVTGKDGDGLAKDLTNAFRLGEGKATKAVRRMIACSHVYTREFELVPSTK